MSTQSKTLTFPNIAVAIIIALAQLSHAAYAPNDEPVLDEVVVSGYRAVTKLSETP